MEKTALVNIEIERGAELLYILDRAGLQLNVALWVILPEYEDWRLVLTARQFDKIATRAAYKLVHEALDTAGFGVEKTPPIMIMPMSNPFIKALRRTFGKARSVDGMRFGGQMIGDRFIEDAYAYRIS